MAAPDEALPTPPPNFVENGISTAMSFLSAYGWFIVITCAVGYYLWNKVGNSAAQYMESVKVGQQKKIDPETVEQRQLAREERISRLQQENDRQSAFAAEKRAELEEKKRLEKIEDWERHQQGKGYRSKVKRPEEDATTTVIPKGEKKPRVRNEDFNPLMGGGGSSAWRSDRRGPGSGRG